MWFIWVWWRHGGCRRTPWFHRALVVAGPLAIVALIAGWVTTEVGRQPWVVYEVMRTEDAVTGASGIPVGFAALGAGLRGARGDRIRDAAPPGAHAVRGGALMLPELAAAFTLVGLTAYVVLGGADFGAGFWDLTAGGAERGAPVRAMIKRAMSPVWEANHVWLIFVLVMLWTAFPEAFGSITSTLAIPMFLAGLGIVLRGGAFALKGHAATIAEARALGATFALSVGARAVLPRHRGRRDRSR